MSELELSLFRQRSHEALKQKARRGELFLGVAAGYVKAGRVRIEQEPDQRGQGYITWDEFEKNQRVIASNATAKGSATVKGAVRRGELLLAGLLRCGHCGRKLHVAYSGKVGRYNCYGARTNHGTKQCISIGGLANDAAVSAEVLRILRPLGIDAAVKALEAQATETSAAQRQLELALRQARYEAAHARRQYDAVD